MKQAGKKQSSQTPDLFAQVAILFRRYCQRDQTERVGFAANQLRGVEWTVAVFLGDVPPKIAEHYQRSEAATGARAIDHTQAYRIERGASVTEAFERIRDDLVHALRLRVQSDSDALLLAVGISHALPALPPGAGDPDGNPGSHSV